MIYPAVLTQKGCTSITGGHWLELMQSSTEEKHRVRTSVLLLSSKLPCYNNTSRENKFLTASWQNLFNRNSSNTESGDIRKVSSVSMMYHATDVTLHLSSTCNTVITFIVRQKRCSSVARHVILWFYILPAEGPRFICGISDRERSLSEAPCESCWFQMGSNLNADSNPALFEM